MNQTAQRIFSLICLCLFIFITSFWIGPSICFWVFLLIIRFILFIIMTFSFCFFSQIFLAFLKRIKALGQHVFRKSQKDLTKNIKEVDKEENKDKKDKKDKTNAGSQSSNELIIAYNIIIKIIKSENTLFSFKQIIKLVDSKNYFYSYKIS